MTSCFFVIENWAVKNWLETNLMQCCNEKVLFIVLRQDSNTSFTDQKTPGRHLKKLKEKKRQLDSFDTCLRVKLKWKVYSRLEHFLFCNRIANLFLSAWFNQISIENEFRFYLNFLGVIVVTSANIPSVKKGQEVDISFTWASFSSPSD